MIITPTHIHTQKHIHIRFSRPDRRQRPVSMTVSEGRKRNHVVAEKKRREAIRKGFDQLTAVIPGLDARHARSEAVVIAKCVETLEKLKSENEQLRQLALTSGIRAEGE